MKNMTMKVFTLLMVLVLVFSLTACGGSKEEENANLAGTTWALSGGSQEGTTVDKATLETLLGGEMVYAFSEDGKVTLSLGDAQVEGTWSQDGDQISLDVQGETGTMTLSGDKLTLEEGNVTVEFTKK